MRDVPGTKNIRCNKYSYYILKYRNGKNTYYGSYPTLIIALMVRDKLIASNWSTEFKSTYTNPEKNINVTWNNKYRVSRTHNGVLEYYGVYDTLQEAKDVKAALEGADWPCVERHYKKYDLPKYITRTPNDSFVIQKKVNGWIKNFGCFKTLKCAVEERDNLIRCDWNYDALESLDETLENEDIVWLSKRMKV